MKISDFIAVVEKIKNFKIKLEKNGITGQSQQVVLKVYIQDLTTKINVDLLKVV